MKLFFERNTLKYHDELIDGNLIKGLVETVQTKGFPQASFFKVESAFSFFRSSLNNFNFGLQLKSGWATNTASPFSPYVVDAFVNVRGSGNRIARGTALQSANFELRKRIYNAPWAFFPNRCFVRFCMVKNVWKELFLASRELILVLWNRT